MSARTLRRAAEREARKTERKLNQTIAEMVPAEPITALLDPEIAEADEILPDAQEPAASQASEAQIAANRENAKCLRSKIQPVDRKPESHGPVTPEGKAAVSRNRRSHGLAGKFILLASENADDFHVLATGVYEEHKPESDTEQRLVDSVIRHYWLTQRAIKMQDEVIAKAPHHTEADGKQLSLFLRYQSTHERSYYKALRELQNIQKQKQKNEIGFESQKRQQQSHEARVRLTQAKAQSIEIDTACRQAMEAPLPGNYRISFEEIAKACGLAIANVAHKQQMAAA